MQGRLDKASLSSVLPAAGAFFGALAMLAATGILFQLALGAGGTLPIALVALLLWMLGIPGFVAGFIAGIAGAKPPRIRSRIGVAAVAILVLASALLVASMGLGSALGPLARPWMWLVRSVPFVRSVIVLGAAVLVVNIASSWPGILLSLLYLGKWAVSRFPFGSHLLLRSRRVARPSWP